MFLCRQSEETFEQILDWLVIRDAMTVIWPSRKVHMSRNTNIYHCFNGGLAKFAE